MSDINKQTKSLNDIAEVQELDNETAAAIQGGWDLEVYDGPNGTGELLGSFNHGTKQIGSVNNDRISSVKVNAGTWRLYNGAWYTGQSQRFGATPGVYNLSAKYDNKTSSILRV